jgi:hypothetical protein
VHGKVPGAENENLISELGVAIRMAFRILIRPTNVQTMDKNLSRRIRIQKLREVGRKSILLSSLLGAITGFLIVGVALIASPLEPGDDPVWKEVVLFYGVIFGVGGFLTAIELMLIYVITMRSARTMVIMNGINPESAFDDDVERTLLLSMIHAGLEAPNSTIPLHGIDPIVNVPRWRLIFAAVAYKAKVSATKLIMKALWRRFVVRILGRSASRAVIEIVSIPVFAGWNAYVTRNVMLELRVRVLGNETVDDAIDYLYPQGFGAIDTMTRQACLLAVRSQITEVADFHPNVTLMLEKLVQEHDLHPADFDGDGEVTAEELDRWKRGCLLELVDELDEVQREHVTRTFAMACALDGRVRRQHRKTLKKLTEKVNNLDFKKCLTKYMKFVQLGIDD